MNPLNPFNDPYAKKIQQEYAFEDTHKMSNFVHKITRNPGVKSVDLKGKHALTVSFMDQNALATTDAIYNESYQPVEENEAARQAKMRKFRQDQGAAAERKKEEIKRMRDAESRRKGDEAMKKRREEEKKRKEQEKKITDDVDRSWTWSQNPLPDVTAALEEVLEKKNLSESADLSEMDPKEHVKKDEKTGMYCVYNKAGKKVKEDRTGFL